MQQTKTELENTGIKTAIDELRHNLHAATPPEEHGRIQTAIHEFFLSSVGLPFFRMLRFIYPVIRFVGLEGIALMFAKRWVAGKKVDDALKVVQRLEKEGITYVLDILGESVATESEADHALEKYCSLLRRLAEECTHRKVSVKLTQLGLHLSKSHCLERMRVLLDTANRCEGFVTIDMEQYVHKEATLHVFEKMLEEYGNVGICLQAYLHDTHRDLRSLMQIARKHNRELHVRLCKGTYVDYEKETALKGHYPNPVFASKEETDRNYLLLAEEMLGNRDVVYSAFATHDEETILKIMHIAETYRISRKQFEFQQLLGIRNDLSRGLAGLEYHVRIYIPFGAQCVPYVMRRISSEPSTVSFVRKHLRKRDHLGDRKKPVHRELAG